jgi:hypothetical protein
LSSKRSEIKLNASGGEKTVRSPIRKKGAKTVDSFTNKKIGVDRAKKLFKDLESELVDLDAGRHEVIRGPDRSHSVGSTANSLEQASLSRPEETSAQFQYSDQPSQRATPVGDADSTGSVLAVISQQLKLKMADIVSSSYRSRIWLAKNPFSWLSILIIIGVLGFSIITSYFASPHQKEYVFLLVCGLGALVLFLRQPTLGLILTLIGSMFSSFSGRSNLNVAVLGVAALLGLWFLNMLVHQRQFRIVRSRPMLPAIIFIVISILAFMIGQLPFFTFAQHAPLDAQIGGFAIFVLSLSVFIMVANQIDDIRWLERLSWTFIALGAIYVLGRLFHWGGIDRIFQSGFSAGSMFWTWLAALSASQVIYNQRLSLFLRLTLVGLLIAIFYVAYIQAGDWKSGWLPPLAAVTVIILLRFRKLALALIPLLIIAAIYLSTRSISTEEYSWGTRLDAWKIVLEIAKVNPILGLGFANYYWYTPLFSIRGWFVSFNSHSQYIDLIAQTGILGLGCFLWLFWETGWLGWRLRDRVPEGFARAYVYGVLGGLVGTLVAGALVDWVLPFVYNIGFGGFRASILAWIFLGGLVCLEQINRRQEQIKKMDPIFVKGA